jgi:DNA polymerase-3 subunit alpha
VVIFSDCYEKSRRIIRSDSMVLVKGRASTKEGEKAKVVASDILGLSKAYQELKPPLHILLFSAGTSEDIVSHLKDFLSAHPGKSPVILHVKSDDQELKMKLKNESVEVSKELLEKLKALVGEKNVYLNRG